MTPGKSVLKNVESTPQSIAFTITSRGTVFSYGNTECQGTVRNEVLSH